MEDKCFYRVVLGGDPDYYFRSYESAAAFLLESYFDDNEIKTEEEVIAANEEVADYGRITDYGYIEEVEFED